jgi:hypothetical protein
MPNDNIRHLHTRNQFPNKIICYSAAQFGENNTKHPTILSHVNQIISFYSFSVSCAIYRNEAIIGVDVISISFLPLFIVLHPSFLLLPTMTFTQFAYCNAKRTFLLQKATQSIPIVCAKNMVTN